MKQRASAPRLIDWTGERFVPWVDDSQLAYEHLHRYAWARTLAEGKRVLDLGAGEGIGSRILAEAARAVTGVDLDGDTVRHAEANYASDILHFRVGDARQLDGIDDDAFDVVVAFEVIEHLQEHDRMLAEVRRILAPGGLVVLSTPNRTLYRHDTGPNPFHRRELDEGEFRELLSGAFAHVALFAQSAHSGSRIEALDPTRDAGPMDVRFQRVADTWMEVDPPPPFYLVALASDSELPAIAATSTLVDHALDIVERRDEARDAEREQAAALLAQERESARQRDAEAAALLAQERESARQRDAEAAAKDAARTAEHQRLAHQLTESAADQERRRVESDLALTTERGARIEAEARARAAVREAAGHLDEAEQLMLQLAQAEESAAAAHELAARVGGSITWRALERLRRYLYRPDGRPRLAGRAVSAGLRSAHRALGNPAPAPAAADAGPYSDDNRHELIVVPTSRVPSVSIVIPIYGGVEHLRACLHAVARSSGDVPFEVIAVDDNPADTTVETLIGHCEGVRYVRNNENRGYLGTVNRGAELATGEFLVTINSDTEPQSGWLDAMVERAHRTPAAAIIGARLVYPDGRLQEAGGIVLRDGRSMNYGNGEDPEDPRFTFARPVDYCSAAAILVRRSVWSDLGGFDASFGPAYYEDTDICFRARQAGHEVWFEPRALVIHHEGGSHGTDVTAGVKRHQVLNRDRFYERWSQALKPAPARDGALARRRASDRRTGPAILVYDGQIPEPDRDSGSLRMSTILRELSALDARVVFVPADGRDRPDYRRELEAQGIEVADAERGRPLAEVLERIGASLDLVILCRALVAASVLPAVREMAPHARVVFDTVDLHFVREAGRFAGRPPRSETVPTAYREVEFGVMRATDLTVVVSDDERRLLADALPDVEVAVLPNAHHVRELVPGREDREGYMFVGGFRHPPNVDAVDWLAAEIWPAVTAHTPGAQLLVVGPDGPERFEDYRDGTIDILGWVADIDPLIDGCVALVAPLRFGAGMKGKVSQALTCGLPVITTSVGAQGLGLIDGEDVLIAETPAEFAAAVARLDADADLWQMLSINGREAARRVCSVETVRSTLVGLVGSG